MEGLATAITDMFPRHLRRPGAREILVLVMVVVFFLLGLPLVTEVKCVTPASNRFSSLSVCSISHSFTTPDSLSKEFYVVDCIVNLTPTLDICDFH